MNSLFSKGQRSLLAIGTAFALLTLPALADVLELTNGDHYRGKVISVNETTVDFQSEIQGRVRLPRNKVAQITFNSDAPKAAPTPAIAPGTNANARSAPVQGAPLVIAQPNPTISNGPASLVVQQMRQQGVDPKVVSQVQAQIIGQSNPEAAQKFNELLGGLLSGSISTDDIRAQAQGILSQTQAMRQELGPEAAGMIDSYVAILQKFVAESAAENPSSTTTTK